MQDERLIIQVILGIHLGKGTGIRLLGKQINLLLLRCAGAHEWILRRLNGRLFLRFVIDPAHVGIRIVRRRIFRLLVADRRHICRLLLRLTGMLIPGNRALLTPAFQCVGSAPDDPRGPDMQQYK